MDSQNGHSGGSFSGDAEQWEPACRETVHRLPSDSTKLRFCFIKSDGFSPLVYIHHLRHTEFLMPHDRQIQPRSGPEKALGSVLREIRKQAGLSQLDVYVKFGIDRTQLSAIERGVQSPTLRTIVRFSKAYRVNLTEMMRRTEKSRFYHP
jgi:DNA-binding XRE family transcriptional regulator